MACTAYEFECAGERSREREWEELNDLEELNEVSEDEESEEENETIN